MRRILFIARDDAHQIRHNVMARILITLLISIPLLFTWFNVLATWDPLSQSDQLRIAVANTDTGYTSDVLNMKVNVGDTVLKELRANNQLDWVITDKDTALDGTRAGTYYAAIILPPNFSTSMFTFYAGGAEPSGIALYTNEKKNPLSATITAQGAEGVTAQINTTFTRVLADVAVSIAEDASTVLQDADTQAVLDRLTQRFQTLSSALESGASTMSSLATVADASLPLATSASSLAQSLHRSVARITDGVEGSGSTEGTQGSDAFSIAASSLDNALDVASHNIADVSSHMNTTLDAVNSTAQSNARILDDLSHAVDQQTAGVRSTRDKLAQATSNLHLVKPAVDQLLANLDHVIAMQDNLSHRLHEMSGLFKQGTGTTHTQADDARAAVRAALDALQEARKNYDDKLAPQIHNLTQNLASAEKDAAVFGSYMDAIRSSLSDKSNGLVTVLRQSQAQLNETSSQMRDGAQRLSHAIDELNKARKTGDLDVVAKALGSDPEAFATLISSPVAIHRNAVFPVASFGVGMTPLFSVISLWIGALLVTAFLRTDVAPNVARRFLLRAYSNEESPNVTAPSERDDQAHEASLTFTPTEQYLGRYMLFWAIGMAQSTLLVLGLIVFVDIQPVHPWLLLVAGWAISTVFTLIVFTLVVSLANAGKALAVVLLVLQISAPGGAYPLELLPQWFQSLSPWLPATYAINLMRSAIAGTYAGDYARNLGILLLFALANIVIGYVLHHGAARLVHSITGAIEKTKVM
ncbi:MAG: YhgE/Pip domain-containing protein [Actinomycetaceae bacterium]|nr:YhgE/Pip domain-containing protein [Actinomycetaceae bacterium]MDY6083326.1 YhgE/Pip domain-containing protein [Actinomycetaceae bacterium]